MLCLYPQTNIYKVITFTYLEIKKDFSDEMKNKNKNKEQIKNIYIEF